jgi:hypothetical protein
MRAASDYLLVDISNSYVKLAFASRERIEKPIRHPTTKLTVAAMHRILRGRKVETIVVSSVVPKKNKTITAAAGSARTLFLSPKLDLGVGIDYPAPKSIGADRLANAAAVSELYGYPAIVVGFGRGRLCRRCNCARARGDDEFSVSAHRVIAQTDSPRTGERDRENDSGRDDVWRSSWISRFGVRNSRAPYRREFPAQKTADDRDRRLCGVDRAKTARD